MGETVRVAAVQTSPSRSSVEDTIFDALELGKKAAQKNADLICLPEHWLPEKNIPPEMDPIPGLQSLAEEYGSAIVGGAFYERLDGRLRLSSPVIDGNGKLVGRQFKVHLFRSENEIAAPGNRHEIFSVNGVKFGVLVCYDIDFPESARTLALQGADLLFCPSRIVKHGLVPWHQYVTVRSLENRIPIVAPNVHSPPWFLGGSVIVDLKENQKTKISYNRVKSLRDGQAAGIIIQDLDLAYHRELRRERFADRRRVAYTQ